MVFQCAHGVATNGEKVYFTDRQAQKICMIINNKVSVIAGCGQEWEVQMGHPEMLHFHGQQESVLNKIRFL